MPIKHEAMTARQYVIAIHKLELTPYSAAPVLGISNSQSYRYADKGGVPETVAKLIRSYLRHGIED